MEIRANEMANGEESQESAPTLDTGSSGHNKSHSSHGELDTLLLKMLQLCN